MKKLLIGLFLLGTISAFGSESVQEIKGFTNLEYSKLASAIQMKTGGLEEVKILSITNSIMEYLRYPYEKMGLFDASIYKDLDYLEVEFSARIDGLPENLECQMIVFKGMEHVSLIDCANDDIELINDHISIDFDELGIEKDDGRLK